MENTSFDNFINILENRRKNLEMEIDEKRNEFWNIILDKVCRYLKAGIVLVEESVKPIYYKGYNAKIWKFTDNEITYEFREENVSSYDGYTRYQVKIDGYGIHRVYESDDKFGHYDTISTNAIRYIIKKINDFYNSDNSVKYEKNKLKEIEEDIEIIK